MNITIISPTQRLPNWVSTAVAEYTKRLTGECHLVITDIPLLNRGKKPIKEILEAEGKQILNAIPKASYVIALTETGKTLSSQALAKHLDKWRQQKQNLCFMIGSPETMPDNCLQRADFILSLSQLTFPHTLIRVILIEQIYRALMILKGHPYHK